MAVILVAYGIYSDLERTDNDDQVLLSYKLETLKPYEAILTKENVHNSGPDHSDARYFVNTGNTEWGVQNMNMILLQEISSWRCIKDEKSSIQISLCML